MEKVSREKKINIQAIVLGTIAVAGVLSIAVAAPKIFEVMKIYRDFKKATVRARYRYSTNVVIQKLLNKGLLTKERRNGKFYYRLSERGALELARYKLKEKKITTHRWDKKWRIVIFDVKETRRGIRDRLRKTLQEFAFVRLQDSVWVSPYECEHVIQLLKAECRIGRDVLYITAENIEQDASLRRHFGLPQ